MCAKGLAQVLRSKEKLGATDTKIPSLLGQATLGKSHNFTEPHPSIRSDEYPTSPGVR